MTQQTESDKIFKKLIKLYDVADELENNGEPDDANKVRKIVGEVEGFILKQKS